MAAVVRSSEAAPAGWAVSAVNSIDGSTLPAPPDGRLPEPSTGMFGSVLWLVVIR